MKNVSKSTKIIPYSVATINPDNGLREKVSLIYNDILDSKEIEIASDMVK